MTHTPMIALKQAHRHDEDHRQRQRPALVLRRQARGTRRSTDSPKMTHRRVGGLQFQERHFRPFVLHRVGQVLVGQVLHQVDRLAGAHARGLPADLSGGVHVVAGEHQRPVDALDAWRSTRWAPSSPCELRTVSRLTCSTLLRKRASACTITSQVRSSKVEVVDVQRAEIDLQRVGGGGERHELRHALLAVEIDEQLRRIGAKDRTKASAKSGLPAGDFKVLPLCDQVVDRRLQSCSADRSVPSRSSTQKVKPPVRPTPRTGAGREDLHSPSGISLLTALR